MIRSVLRRTLVVFVLIVVAAPAFSQDPDCKNCCDNGRETCEMRQWNGLQVCRGAGVQCSYLEVYG